MRDQPPAAKSRECNGPRDCIGTEQGCDHCDPEVVVLEGGYVYEEAADWLEYFRESANPQTAEERWAYLDTAAVHVELLLAEQERLFSTLRESLIPLHLLMLAESVLDDFPLQDNHGWWRRTAEKLARLLLEHARLNEANAKTFGLDETPGVLRSCGGDDPDVRDDTAKDDFVFPHDNIISGESSEPS